MARAFIVRVMKTSTNPAAAAFAWNAASGREVQLNIWIGITVNGDHSHSKDTKGGSALSGAGGRKAMKVSARMVMIGAVSPMARAMPMMTPVRMPGEEYGRMWWRTVCQRVAPTA